jgi:hypothetical protein
LAGRGAGGRCGETDTDQLNAIEALLDVLDEHAGQGWADEQAQSGFGKKAAGTVKELNEAIVDLMPIIVTLLEQRYEGLP